jgi:hypothetical protein
MRRPVFRIYLRFRRTQQWVARTRWVNTAFRIVVFLLMVGLLWYELGSRERLSDMWIEFKRHLEGANWLVLLSVIALMPINWLAETEKWYQFVRHYEPMPRRVAVMAVLAGVSLSLFTPNRVGEYGGRILFVRPENQWRAIIANLVGNFCQFMVLLGLGIIGAAYTVSRFLLIDRTYAVWIIVAASIVFLGMIWVYFNLEGLLRILRRMPYFNEIKWIGKRLRLDVLRSFNRSELLDILRWALIRYVVYTLQYYLLLRFFGIEADLVGGIAGIAGLFLLQTSIPLPPMTGLMARGNLAVVLWSQFGANELAALAATFSLWVINLILPALIGTFCLLHVNIRKTLGYAEDSHSDGIHPPDRTDPPAYSDKRTKNV